MTYASFIQLLALAGFVVSARADAHAGKAVFLVIDVQDCFLEANTTSGQPGTLSVPASHIIPIINQIRAEKSCLFEEVIFSQDFHPANHISFGSTHGLAPFAHLGGKGSLPLMCITPTSGYTKDGACCPGYYINSSKYNCSEVLCPPTGWDYAVNNTGIITNNAACTTCKDTPEACFETDQAMWTDHCLQSGDSTFPPMLDKRAGDTVVQKGGNQYVDAYSAFMDNTASLKTDLDATLASKGVTTIYVAGIATDVCVQWSVRDALSSKTSNYKVKVIKDATAAVLGNMDNYNAAVKFMEDQGAEVVTSTDILAMSCPTSTPPTQAPTTAEGNGTAATAADPATSAPTTKADGDAVSAATAGGVSAAIALIWAGLH